MVLSEAKLSIYQAVALNDSSRLSDTVCHYMENPVFLMDCGYHPLFQTCGYESEQCSLWRQQAASVLKNCQLGCSQAPGNCGETWMIEPIIVQSILVGYAAVCDADHAFRPTDRELLRCIADAAALQCGLLSQMIQFSDLSPHSHRMLFDDLLDLQIPHASALQQRLDDIGWTASSGLYVIDVALRDMPAGAQFPMLQYSISQQIDQIVPVYTYTYHFNQLILLLCFGDVSEPAMSTAQADQLELLLRNMKLVPESAADCIVWRRPTRALPRPKWPSRCRKSWIWKTTFIPTTP